MRLGFAVGIDGLLRSDFADVACRQVAAHIAGAHFRKPRTMATSSAPPQLSYDMADLATLADLASRIAPRNRCLVRSLVLMWLLQTRGESAELVLGVRKRGGNFEAHAWTVSGTGTGG